MADQLAKAALRTARRMTAPFRRHLEGMAMLFKSQTLVVHVTKGLDQCAVDRCMPIVPRMAHLAGRRGERRWWQATLPTKAWQQPCGSGRQHGATCPTRRNSTVQSAGGAAMDGDGIWHNRVSMLQWHA